MKYRLDCWKLSASGEQTFQRQRISGKAPALRLAMALAGDNWFVRMFAHRGRKPVFMTLPVTAEQIERSVKL